MSPRPGNAPAGDPEPYRAPDLASIIGAASRAMVWSWDLATNRVTTNEILREILGDVPGEFATALVWWRERVSPDAQAQILHVLERGLFGSDTMLRFEYHIRDRKGVQRLVDDRVTINRDANGTPSQIIGAAHDLTESRRIQESQGRLLQILEATPDVVGIAGVDGRLINLNRAGRAVLGLDADAPLTGHSMGELQPSWAMEVVRHEGISVALANGMWQGETAVLTREGGELPVSQIILAHTRPDGSIECISTIMRDISERRQEEVTRIEWANRYDAAIRASGQVLIDWNSLTNEVTYGGNLEQFVGYSAAEMYGGLDRLRELIHADDVAAFDQEIARVTATRDPFDLKFRLQRKDDRVIRVQAKGYFFIDRDGRLSRMVGFMADVSAQHDAQEELARAQEGLETRVAERTMELARAYIVIQDRALQQEAVAHLGQQALAGVSLDALLDETTALIRTILKVDLCAVLELTEDKTELVPLASVGWPPESKNVRLSSLGGSQAAYTLQVGEPVIVEDMQTETRFGVSPYVSEAEVVSGVTVMIATGEQRIGVLTAFTLQRRKFTKDDVYFLQSVANVLTAAIVRQRAEERIRQAHEQAELANRAKSEFLSRMSHELRTPLNAILGFTQLLELDSPSPSQAESITHITRAGKHLLSLINEVLDIARIEAGRLALSPESIPVNGFLNDVVQLIRPVAQRHEVTVHFESRAHDPAIYVLADQQRLKQVMLNLLSNAVKYNRQGGDVYVSVQEGRPGACRIDVRDTGQGIAPELVPRLFLPFERLGAESTDTEGTGIGLVLSRGIVTALNGELTVESTPGVGSTFSVMLPRTGAPPQEIAIPPLPGLVVSLESGRVHTLLYIEDQDLNLRLVERILLKHPHYRLISAMQGRLGLDLAREHRPDLILLDLNLPDLPGEEVLARLKTDPATRDIPVIMVSADAMGDRIEQLLQQGASGYLTKPYKVAEFLKVIGETLGG